ncbi:GNAT family N-acetyltransferase [Ignavigranum ruoffiae]|uniref:Predicted acetyltransferase n=1 Tax=Ignavigranum ruoffiae TaxID=89093 RepID=A0A1H9EFY5_9LACT|nr:GNAT family N-acetyltransferase [Ignavigranum ruoffiae]SEQ24545.1 Predicted acetyltransferase [Ignavigranum ruoffiae]
MKLRRPNEQYLDAYRQAIQEDYLHRPHLPCLFLNPDTIIQKAVYYEYEENLPPGIVNSSIFWLIDQNKFIGEIHIRHQLTPALLNYGGHIGYEVRWSEEGKGYGTQMLSKGLEYCRETLGLARVLLTCDDNNWGSIRVIEKNGGILQNKLINELGRGTVTSRRYWIEL